ncbi:MAG TPA: hypothetical protein VGF82_19800 [Terracidiphilus sp.]|jgi:hypothetical protein
MRRFLVISTCVALSLVARGQSAPAHVQFNTAGAGAKQAEIEAAVQLICPAGKATHGKDGKVSGCAVCPRDTDFQGQPNTPWEMYAETPGHFTSAKDDNLLLDGTGCDSHANNFGGTFVFGVAGEKARLLHYENGLITDQCQKFAYGDKRDGLVCHGGWSGQGLAEMTVFVTSFAASGKASTKVLVHTTDTTAACGQDREQVVKQGGISEVNFVSRSQGAAGEVSGLMIKAYTGDVKCSVVEAVQKTRRAPASVKNYTIEFTFDEQQFRVASGSRSLLAKFAVQ